MDHSTGIPVHCGALLRHEMLPSCGAFPAVASLTLAPHPVNSRQSSHALQPLPAMHCSPLLCLIKSYP